MLILGFKADPVALDLDAKVTKAAFQLLSFRLDECQHGGKEVIEPGTGIFSGRITKKSLLVERRIVLLDGPYTVRVLVL